MEPPERLRPEHDLSGFESGEPLLDQWLRTRALANEGTGASRTYVVSIGERVVGYYALAVGAIDHHKAPGRIRRNIPDPVSVMVIGRLAVDRAVQGQGVGVGLLRDAVVRSIQAAHIAGIRAVLIHSKNESAKRFYERYGFVASPVDPLTMMITVADAVKTLG